MELKLIRPSCEYAGQVMNYKEEMHANRDNVASRKTITKNGGVLENEIADDIGLGECGIIQRYWIIL